MLLQKKLAFDGCTQGDKCFLKCVFICSTSVWTSWIARFHSNNYRFRAVCDLNIPRSSLCSVVVLTHVLLKLIQPRQEPEQAGRGPTCQLLQPPPVVFLNPNDRFGSFEQQEDSRNTTDDARLVGSRGPSQTLTVGGIIRAPPVLSLAPSLGEGHNLT